MAFKMKGAPYPKKASAHKRYGKEEEYKVFNMGNEPTPMKAHAAGHGPDNWEPAYEGGDYSWSDLAAMSKDKLKSLFPDTHEKISKDLADRRIKSGKKVGKAVRNK